MIYLKYTCTFTNGVNYQACTGTYGDNWSGGQCLNGYYGFVKANVIVPHNKSVTDSTDVHVQI